MGPQGAFEPPQGPEPCVPHVPHVLRVPHVPHRHAVPVQHSPGPGPMVPIPGPLSNGSGPGLAPKARDHWTRAVLYRHSVPVRHVRHARHVRHVRHTGPRALGGPRGPPGAPWGPMGPPGAPWGPHGPHRAPGAGTCACGTCAARAAHRHVRHMCGNPRHSVRVQHRRGEWGRSYWEPPAHVQRVELAGVGTQRDPKSHLPQIGSPWLHLGHPDRGSA